MSGHAIKSYNISGNVTKRYNVSRHVVHRCNVARHVIKSFISPPNIYMTNIGLVPGRTGGYYARWCQRAL